MVFKKYIYLLIISLFCIGLYPLSASDFSTSGNRKSRSPGAIKDSLSWSLSLMKRVFSGSGEWYMTNPSFQKGIKGVVNYAENDPIDTVIVKMNQYLKSDSIPRIFYRKAENIPDKRVVPGYLFSEELDRLVEGRRKAVADSLRRSLIVVPESYLSEGLSRVPVISDENPTQMMSGMEKRLPERFISKFNQSWEMVKLPANATAAEIDTMRMKLFISIRQSYNDSILFSHRDSLMQSYRENIISQNSNDAASRRKDYLLNKNRELLNTFNEAEVSKVNDSIRVALRFLTERAAGDSSLVTITNLSGLQTKMWTANQPRKPIRFFLKNEQNDSVGVVLSNNGKGGIRMVIDDGVKFMRFTETQKKEITFKTKKPDSNLQQINLKHVDPLPWKLFGTGTVGFTQTSLSNWAKGGESSFSMLLIEKYIANYSKKKLKWESMAEFRLGIFKSQTRGLEKNDDKFEFQSRVGYAASKNWYYSGETNFRTQIAKGYKYPDKDNPISMFMAPAYLTTSLGMDYKPNKNFSVFLSPFTSKITFVNDTALIDPTHYGLDPGKRRLWEPGAIVKLNWHHVLIEDVIYDTRAEIFNNYRYPFQKFNVDWEQTLVLQVSRRISTRINTQLVYDYNVKFPIKDANGVEVAQKAKWQFKELFTVGFNYKF
ncbi:MAG: DUF3078 domain-containing protein [Prolixibacteraceae bacterium]|nr:DUF3078 domain-containing protein [Prolixibacteraceae bacterium]